MRMSTYCCAAGGSVLTSIGTKARSVLTLQNAGNVSGWKTCHVKAGEMIKKGFDELHGQMCVLGWINMYTHEDMAWHREHFSAEVVLCLFVKGCNQLHVDHKPNCADLIFRTWLTFEGHGTAWTGESLGFKEPERDRPVRRSCNHMWTCWKGRVKKFSRVCFEQTFISEQVFNFSVKAKTRVL